MIQASESERVYVEILLGIPRSKSTVRMRPEIERFWDELTAEVKQMRADGKGFLIPSEFPSVAPTDGTQVPDLRAQPRKPNGQFGSGSDGGQFDYGGDPPPGYYAAGGPGAPAAGSAPASAGSESYAAELEIKLQDQQAGTVGVDKLTGIEEDDLRSYTGFGHYDVNKAARGAPPPPLTGDRLKNANERGESVNGIINRTPPLTEPIVVQRAVDTRALGVKSTSELSGLVGAEFVDKGIVSTSLSKKVAQKFSDDAVSANLVINVPKGSRAYAVPDGLGFDGASEFEVLLPSNTKFKITKVVNNEVYVDVVG